MPARRGVFLVFALIAVGVLVSAGALLVLALVGGTSPSVPERATLYLKVDAPFSEVEPAASEVIDALVGSVVRAQRIKAGPKVTTPTDSDGE